MNDDHDYIEFDDMFSSGMGAIAWLLVAIFITVLAGLIAWGIHAAIAGAGTMPAGCTAVECAAEGGL